MWNRLYIWGIRTSWGWSIRRAWAHSCCWLFAHKAEWREKDGFYYCYRCYKSLADKPLRFGGRVVVTDPEVRPRRYEPGDVFQRGHEWFEVIQMPVWNTTEGCWVYWCRQVVFIFGTTVSPAPMATESRVDTKIQHMGPYNRKRVTYD